MRTTEGRHRRHLLAAPLALAFLLAACQSPPKDRPLTSEVPEPPGFATAPENCQAAGARFGVGLLASQPLLDDMRRRAGALAARTVPATSAGAAASGTGPDATRLSVQVDPAGRVVGAYCG